MSEKIRCFIALPVDEKIRQGAKKLVSSLQGLPTRVSWVRPSNLHLTIRFLGDQEQSFLPALHKALESACQDLPTFELQYQKLGAFPPKRAPRTLWVGVGGELETLHRLNDNLTKELSSLGIPKEKRQFSPHLTLGRVRKHLSYAQWTSASAQLGLVDLGSCKVSKCLLMKSELQKGQAPIYSSIATIELGARA